MATVASFSLIVAVICNFCHFPSHGLPVGHVDVKRGLFDWTIPPSTEAPSKPPSSEQGLNVNITSNAASTPSSVSFHVQIPLDIPLRASSRPAVYKFSSFQAAKPGQFVNGSSLNIDRGNLIIPLTGVYLFIVSAQVTVPIVANLTGSVGVAVCPTYTNCEPNIENSPLFKNEQIVAPGEFTVSVTGILKLKVGTLVSFYFGKRSPIGVTIKSSSTCSGLFIKA